MPAVQFKDYYQTLGVERGADEKAVRTAFRTLARKHHPDLNPGDAAAEERFKEINEAFEVLTDAEKRKLYDRFGEDWQRYRDAGFTGDEPAGRPGGARGGADPNDFGAWYSGQTGGSGAAGTGGPQWTTFTAGDGDDAEGFSDFFQTLFGSRGDDGGRARTATSAQRRSRPRRRC